MSTNCDEELVLTEAGGMRLRIYRPTSAVRGAPVVLHLHGGAFTGGSLDSGRLVPGLLAGGGAVVASASYPLAPQHRFPHALQAAFAALQSLHERRSEWA